MDIKSKFLELTSRTYPHGTEEDVFPLLSSELEKDEFGNLFIKIGESDVMFTSHLDTATSALTEVVHVIDGPFIKTDGKSILGADDKAGVTIMLNMIENKIPGLYYFFLGEEVGCVGSRKVANKLKTEKIEGINKVISFDRRGTDSVITFQSGQRCCSEKFGEELSKQLNQSEETFSYKNDPTGILTDSIQFVSIYPECTNISVGYGLEHTTSEYQDIDFLSRLCKSVVKIDWETLPVMRDPYDVENDSPGWDDEDDYEYDFGDDEYVEDFYSYFQIGKEVKKMYISKYIIENESNLIREWIKKTDGYSDITDINWNGNSLYVNNVGGGYTFVGKRIDNKDNFNEAWQMPQGGIDLGEDEELAMFR